MQKQTSSTFATSSSNSPEAISVQSSDSASIHGGTAVSLLPLGQAPAELKQRSTRTTSSAAAKKESWSTSVQNVLDQPPSALPQRLILGGIAFCMAFSTWASLAKIDEIGHSQGQLVPKGDTYQIHPLELGKIASIHAKEGEVVKAGQVLVELDTELAAQEVERLEQLIRADQEQLTQMQALIDKTRLETQSRIAIAQADTRAQEAALAQVQAKADATRELLTQHQAMFAAAQAKLARLQPLEATTQELLQQRQEDAAAQKERLERLEPLLAAGAISKEVVFQAEQSLRDRQRAITESKLQEQESIKEQLFQAQQSIRNQQSAITENQGELQQTLAQAAQLEAELSQKQTEVRRTQIDAQQQIQKLEVEITQLKTKITENQNLLKSAQANLKQRFLYAPVDGVISSLNVANIGEVVQSGQSIAEIAPEGAPLVLSANLPSSEAGFIKEGMPVQVKFDAYPYQDYGIISGTVTSVSADATTEPELGTFYEVEVTLDRDYVTEENQKIHFKAGQTASADIIIRRRRIADMLLDPIRKLQAGGINM